LSEKVLVQQGKFWKSLASILNKGAGSKSVTPHPVSKLQIADYRLQIIGKDQFQRLERHAKRNAKRTPKHAKSTPKARQHAKSTPKGWRATFSSEMLKHAKSTPARQKMNKYLGATWRA